MDLFFLIKPVNLLGSMMLLLPGKLKTFKPPFGGFKKLFIFFRLMCLCLFSIFSCLVSELTTIRDFNHTGNGGV